MSKRKSRDEVEPSREFPNPFAEYSAGQLVDASGKVELEILDADGNITVSLCGSPRFLHHTV